MTKSAKSSRSRGLWLIATFKLLKASLLLIVALGALKFIHRNVADDIARWADTLRIDPNNRYFNVLLAHASKLDRRKLRALSVGTFFYSALFFTEGIGLSLRCTWAEYLTIISTASLLPLEIFELVRRTTGPRVFTLVVNLGVVAYLVVELETHRRSSSRAR